MEKIFILLVCGTIYTFTFINVIRLSGKNYKEDLVIIEGEKNK